MPSAEVGVARRPRLFVRPLSLEEGRKLQRITRTAKNPVRLRRAMVLDNWTHEVRLPPIVIDDETDPGGDVVLTQIRHLFFTMPNTGTGRAARTPKGAADHGRLLPAALPAALRELAAHR
jgi:hypothetical protein